MATAKRQTINHAPSSKETKENPDFDPDSQNSSPSYHDSEPSSECRQHLAAAEVHHRAPPAKGVAVSAVEAPRDSEKLGGGQSQKS
jgi:hypothetical protein